MGPDPQAAAAQAGREAPGARQAGARRAGWPRPRLIDLYLVRGLIGPFLLVAAAATIAMMLERALRLIQEMAASGAHVSFFFPMLGQLLPYYLNLALPAAFMTALVLLIARLDERLELETLLASGLSLGRIAAPLVVAGLAVAAASLVVGGFLEPHGRYGFRSLRVAAVNAGRIRDLQPKAFYRPVEGVALSVDAQGEEGARGLFLRQRTKAGDELILTASEGRIGLAPGAREIDISFGPGLYYLHRKGAGATRPLAVRHQGMAFRDSLLVDNPSWARGWDQAELTLAELAAARAGGSSAIPPRKLDAELYTRLARALTLPLIPLLVLPLCVAAKRGRRGLGVVAAGAVLMAFHHGLNFARNLGRDALDPALTVGLFTSAFAMLVLVLFVSGRHLPSHGPIIAAHAWLRRGAGGLPRSAGALPMRTGGRTISFYVAWQFAKWSLATAAAIAVLLQMVDIFDRGDAFVERGMGPADMGRYALLRLPAILQQTIPVAALAGAMIAFIHLARSQEMVAIRSAGISQYRLFLMILPAAALLSLSVFVLADRVAPRSEVALTGWWRATAPAADPRPERDRWFRIGGDIVRAARASPDGGRLEDLTIYRRDSQGLLFGRIAARSASLEGGAWILRGVETAFFLGRGPTSVGHAPRLTWHTPLRGADVRSYFAASPYISSDAARRSLAADAPVGQSDAFFRTRLQRMVAEPLAPILMVLLALPLAFSPVRTGPSWLALGWAAGGGLAYVVLDGVLTVTAQLGMIPVTIGAWTAPALFGLLGLTAILYSER